MRNNDAQHGGELRTLRSRLRPVRAGLAGLVDRRSRRAAVVGLVCCLGLVTVAQARGELGTDPSADAVAVDERAAAPAAGRGAVRAEPSAPDGESPLAGGGQAATPADPDVPTERAQPAKPAAPAKIEDRIDPGPVAGLTAAQMDNAKAIVRTGRDMGMPRRALIIAVATAMQESNLLNLASGVVPESMDHPNQGVGWDHDSVGLFQQRSSTGWGPVRRLMDPAFATAQFLTALRQVPGWQQMALTDAAQAVQVSGFPWAYAKHESRATEVVDAIVPGWA